MHELENHPGPVAVAAIQANLVLIDEQEERQYAAQAGNRITPKQGTVFIALSLEAKVLASAGE